MIKYKSKEWSGTGLLLDSTIKLHKIVSLPKNIIKRKLGEINIEVQQKIDSKLKEVFELE